MPTTNGPDRMSAREYRQVMGLDSPPARPHKYGIGPKVDRAYNGIVYHSVKEALKAAEYDLLVRGGLLRHWRRQVPFPLHVGEIHLGDYHADFVLTHLDWHLELVECKGVWTPLAAWKWRHFQAEHAPAWRARGGIITIV